jgi:integral membrane protein
MIRRVLKKFEKLQPFSDHEAWTLFRLAAIGEAGGWTLLITGIGLKQYALHGNNLPVLIAGQIHGTIFIIYIVAALGLYPSLGWSRGKAFVAGLASVPPYGSIIFEQWAAHRRNRNDMLVYRRCIAYAALANVTVST